MYRMPAFSAFTALVGPMPCDLMTTIPSRTCDRSSTGTRPRCFSLSTALRLWMSGPKNTGNTGISDNRLLRQAQRPANPGAEADAIGSNHDHDKGSLLVSECHGKARGAVPVAVVELFLRPSPILEKTARRTSMSNLQTRYMGITLAKPMVPVRAT